MIRGIEVDLVAREKLLNNIERVILGWRSTGPPSP